MVHRADFERIISMRSAAVLPRTAPTQAVWKAAYRAAISENNHRKLPARIASAQAVLRTRLRELRNSVEQRQERDCVESAMRMLDLLLRTPHSP